MVGKPAPQGFFARYRWLLTLVAAAVIVAGLCGGGTVMALNNGFLFNSPASLSGLSATQTARAGRTPTETPLPTTTPVPTATLAPTETPVPPQPTYLTFMPKPLILVKSGVTCSGTETITNGSSQRLGWAWTSASPSLDGYTFYINGHKSAGLPQNMSPGLASHTSDTVLVQLSNCQSHQTPITITAKDSLGHTYSFAIKPS